MGDNITLFGDVADDYDALFSERKHELEQWVELEGYSDGSVLLASSVFALFSFSQSMIDTLRLGNPDGIVNNALRLLTLCSFLPVASIGGAVFHRISRLLVVSKSVVQGENALCFFVSLENALAKTAYLSKFNKYYAFIRDFAEDAFGDIQEFNTFGHGSDVVSKGVPFARAVPRVINRLRSVGIPVEEVTAGSLDKLNDVVRGYGKGSMVFTVSFKVSGQTDWMAHTLQAICDSSGRVQIFDTNGEIFKDGFELVGAYQKYGASSLRFIPEGSFFVPNAAIVKFAEASEIGADELTKGAGLVHLVLPLIPVKTEPPSTKSLGSPPSDSFRAPAILNGKF